MSLNALVVDDSMLIRHTVCRYLEERGFAVETAANGQEALETLKRLLPDLIITDMHMPKMGGTEFITALKSNAETASIPIVVVSSKHNESIKKENSGIEMQMAQQIHAGATANLTGLRDSAVAKRY